jgi:23S rRNA pseudouridine955/2504/2580 synthase
VSGVETRSVSAEDDGQRLDRWFKRHYPGLAFGRLAKLLRTGQIRVDGKRAKPATRVAEGQEIRIPPLLDEGPEPHPGGATAEQGPSRADVEMLQNAVLYRDDWVIAIDKPAGLATQGGSKLTRHLDAMLDALRFDAADRPRLVHRLDLDTSGVLLLGRSPKAAKLLGDAFRSKAARKLYWALTAGVPDPDEGRIDLPLAKLKRGGGEKMGHDPAGKPAVTVYRTLMTHKRDAAWLALSPLTGRTHQLRAHLVAIGTPILGDGKYGGPSAFPDGLDVDTLQLHAREIALPHPADGTTLRISAPMPRHMGLAFQQLGFDPDRGEGVYPDLAA